MVTLLYILYLTIHCVNILCAFYVREADLQSELTPHTHGLQEDILNFQSFDAKVKALLASGWLHPATTQTMVSQLIASSNSTGYGITAGSAVCCAHLMGWECTEQ